MDEDKVAKAFLEGKVCDICKHVAYDALGNYCVLQSGIDLGIFRPEHKTCEEWEAENGSK
jgi:hypothetical protein